jgi:hypothetical protein
MRWAKDYFGYAFQALLWLGVWWTLDSAPPTLLDFAEGNLGAAAVCAVGAWGWRAHKRRQDRKRQGVELDTLGRVDEVLRKAAKG